MRSSRAALLSTLCVAGLVSDRSLADDAAERVRIFGSLRAVMHEGKTDAVAKIADVAPGPHTYAVGALAGLRGEVTILDDEVWVSYPREGGGVRTEVSRRSDETAALLVAARVDSWRRVRLSKAVGSGELDDQIAALARKSGVDVNRPFPIVVTGTVRDLAWHVVDGRRLTAGASHEEHRGAGVRGRIAKKRATLVGFYSDQHQGVFTHMGERTHLHVVLRDEKLTGHVDAVTIERGATVLLPR